MLTVKLLTLMCLVQSLCALCFVSAQTSPASPLHTLLSERSGVLGAIVVRQLD